ncbi:hypothetical protein [Aquisediminimonas sediminicola]|uniref:hypothetical protein n=1 Tax=Alteraquisediminimonas sediminicola TaxID=2676787 RepID=UPI001C8D3C02|nr:hypothetical protein [Aquisediminimonas sediminicola]
MSQVVLIAVTAPMIAMGATPVIPVTGAMVAGAATARIMPGISVHLGYPARSDLVATLPNMPITMISTSTCNVDAIDRLRGDRSESAPQGMCNLTEFQ